jgi:7-keto-8-aminopelargonate synthetase-like enzyme
VIVVDALYSTDGSLAPLHDVVAIAERSGSVLVVDESHSLGTHGPRGAGLVIAAGLEDRVHFRTASLAKAFAGRAGIITCSSRFKGYFLSESRPAIFSSCMLNHELAWFDAAIDFVEQADARRAALRRVTAEVRTGLGRARLLRRRGQRADHRAGGGHRAEDAGAAQGAGKPRHPGRRVLRPGHAEEPRAGAADAELRADGRARSRRARSSALPTA